MLSRRACGILLHPSSLPGDGGIGVLGAAARSFIDFISEAGVTYWQVLPLTPPACGNSPYSSFSAFAGNPLLIDLEQLVFEGDISGCNAIKCDYPDGVVDFEKVTEFKTRLLYEAGLSFLSQETTPRKTEFWHFCDSTPWLHHFALFMALKQKYGGKGWDKWPKAASLLTPEMYEKASVECGLEIGVQKYLQWQFYRQWNALRNYATSRGIRIIGDIPIFVAFDSVDVWSHRDLFLLDKNGKPTDVAGVPPDYFSRTGQLWGNPLYDWEQMKRTAYSWWIDRFKAMYSLYDIVRIDHFRGFEAAWHVPVTHRTAQRGQWVKGPGGDFFDSVFSELGQLPIIAEDLGVMTSEVEVLRDRYSLPGMKILQFAFDSGATNSYLPHNHVKNSVVYTGTHDNDTTAGWLSSLSISQRNRIRTYLGMREEKELLDALMRTALMSVADTVIFPLQDLLGLGSGARMNVPGTACGNWGWRFTWDQFPDSLSTIFKNQLELYGRVRVHVE